MKIKNIEEEIKSRRKIVTNMRNYLIDYALDTNNKKLFDDLTCDGWYEKLNYRLLKMEVELEIVLS